MSDDLGVFVEYFQTERLLGQGRLSRVYLARDLRTQTPVALKILLPHLREQASVVRRFRREMAAVQRLVHPALVRVHDLIESEQHMALVMEYAPGRALKELVRDEGAMVPERVVRLGRALLDGLEHAHQRGIWHRDLSLANVLVDADDTLKIIGFGLARVDELVGLTMHTRVLGALETMAPESILGLEADARADIFSAGAMLFELATGAPLHDGRMSSSLAFASRADYLDGVKASLEGMPDSLVHAICRALAPDPALRFASARQMREALDGHYDVEVWAQWDAREPSECPACKRVIVEGLGHCLHCGHAFERLLQEPGRGEHALHIITPHQAFKREVWFEANTEPMVLADRQVKALHELMFSFDDTRRVFQANWNDEHPPYMLINGLTESDAALVKAQLEQRGVPCRVQREALKDSALRRFIRQRSVSPVAIFFGAIVVFYFLVTLALFLPMLVTASVENNLLLPGLGFITAFLVGAYWSRRATKFIEAKISGLGIEEDEPPKKARILGTELSAIDLLAAENILPAGVSQALGKLRQPALQRELHDVLALTVRLFRDKRVPTAALRETLEPMFEHTVALLERLSSMEVVARDRNTAQIFDALESVDARIAAITDAAAMAPLIEQRVELLNALDALDAATHERSLIQGHLLHVRATLLDLQSEFGGEELPSLESVSAEIASLRARFEAQHEVLELVRSA
ncbi:MAG: serine/threonine protein kinase [Bradymonadaceae bacterium]|nr:serine/threonine protein kinase [Lujinxingiaceae bacterium]